jgi:hypothetical protein
MKVRGLRSGDSTLSRAELAEQREARAVVLKQRGGIDHPLMVDALGRFCLKHHGRDLELAGSRYAAGLSYGELIENARIALGLKPKILNYMGEDHIRYPLNYQQQMALRELTEKQLRGAESALRAVDNATVRIVRELAYEGNEISIYDEGRAMNGLYRLAVHFGLEKMPFVP